MDDISREGKGNRAEITGLRYHLEEADTRFSRLTDEAKASSFELRSKGEVEAELRRELEAEAERRGIIEAEARTGDDMAEEALEEETRRMEEAEEQPVVATEALERAAKESERREVEEALRREEEGERSDGHQLTVEREIEVLKRM